MYFSPPPPPSRDEIDSFSRPRKNRVISTFFAIRERERERLFALRSNGDGCCCRLARSAFVFGMCACIEGRYVDVMSRRKGVTVGVYVAGERKTKCRFRLTMRGQWVFARAELVTDVVVFGTERNYGFLFCEMVGCVFHVLVF